MTAGALGGCEGFATDTPLGVTTTAHVFAPGEPVTGDVIYPDGKMTVTISARSTPHTEGEHSDGAIACEYESGKKTFSCPTSDLVQGLYVVQVTDGDQPGEGTALEQVAVAPFEGYDPMISRAGEDADTDAEDAEVGEPARLLLTGWRPGVAVKVALVFDGGADWDAATLIPGADGTVEWKTKPLRSGYYTVEASDGLWKVGGEDGERAGAHYGFRTLGAT